VADSEFFFAIDLHGPSADELLDEVVLHVLRQAGSGVSDGGQGTVSAIRAAVADGTEAQGQCRCRLTFLAENGHLEIAVTSAAGLWQTTHVLG
jgi:hypothetical protein